MQLTYYFGRLNLLTERQDKVELIKQTIANRTVLPDLGYSYAFANTQEAEEGTFIIGELIKYRPRNAQEVFNEANWQTADTETSNIVVARVPFVLELSSNYLAYHPSRYFPGKLFIGKFAELFNISSNQALTVAEISPLSSRTELLQEITSFSRITYIKVTLQPSNPHPSRLWKEFDDLMKEEGIDSYTEVVQAKKSEHSIPLSGGLHLEEKIAMAADGYGTARVEGEKDGQPVTAQTGQLPVTAQVPSGTFLDGVVSFLKTTFGSLNRQLTGEDS